MQLRLTLGTLLLAALVWAQPARNLDFSEGSPGALPPGWTLGNAGAVYRAEIAPASACNGSRQCALVHNIGDTGGSFTFLYQVIEPGAFRGGRLRYRAAVRVDAAQGSVARLLVRVHRLDGSTSFRDDMGANPITSGTWATYEINAPVGMDARDIEFGVQLWGRGAAWIDKISMTVEDPQLESVRALIGKFSDARNAHDGNAVAEYYAENGEYLRNGAGPVRGRAALADMWGRVTGQAKRTVDAVIPITPDIAIARVSVEFDSGPVRRGIDVMVMSKDESGWKIQLHQAVEWTPR